MTKKYEQENQYILNSIDPAGYNVNQSMDDKEKLQFLYDTFYSEYGWHIKRDGEFKALIDYLQGLPSCINIAFENYRILELAKQWGSLPENPTEKQEDNILENYWKLMAMRIISLWNKNKIIRKGT